MKPIAILASLLLLAGTWVQAAEGSGKDDVKAASKKLAEKGAYSWKSTVESAGGGGGGGGGGARGRMGPTEGKVSKDGVTCLKMTRGDTTTEAFLQGTKGAVKTQDGWQSLEALTSDAGGGGGGGGGGGNPSRFLARTLQNMKAPAAEAEDLAGKAKELKMADGAVSGDLTEDGAKSLLSFGGRGGGGGGPAISNASGSVKFWVKDGVLSKYQYHVKGTVSFNGNDREVDRTTTVEISEVGTTTVTVPEEAKKKLS